MPPPSHFPHPQPSLPPVPAPPPPQPPPQYPAYLFPLSPTFTTWSRLTIHQIHHSLSTGTGGFSDPPQNIYFWGNKPIKWVRIVGVVVSWDVYEKRYAMTVDDGSGETVEVVCGRKVLEDREANDEREECSEEGKHNSQHIPSIYTTTATPKEIALTSTSRTLSLTPFSLGSIIKAKGSITTFRGIRQLSLERIFMVKDTAEEARCWAENTAFTRDVLEKPWVVGDEEERKWRRRAEGRGSGERRKRKEEKEERRKRESAREGRIGKEGQMRRRTYEGREYAGKEKMVEDQDEETQARRRKAREERHSEKDRRRKQDMEKASS